MRHRVLAVIATAVIGSAIAAAPSAAQLPVIYNGVLGYAHISATAIPPGANNCSCHPSAAHPRPVVLVHGTFADMSDSWQALSPLLVNNGYCVFAFNYGSANGSGLLGIDASRRHTDLRRPALDVRQSGADRHRRQPGRPRRPLARRDDAALLPEEPRRRRQGAHVGRARAVQPRHDARRADDARGLLPGRQRVPRRVVRGLHAAGGRLDVHHRAERRR